MHLLAADDLQFQIMTVRIYFGSIPLTIVEGRTHDESFLRTWKERYLHEDYPVVIPHNAEDASVRFVRVTK